MRFFISALLCGVLTISSGANAQTWPARSIRLIAPVSAGIATDVAARMLAENLSRALGQQVYVENVPGAAGTLGTAAAARVPADGYTLLFASAGMLSTNKFLFKSLPFDLDRDLVPVAIVCRGTPFAVSVFPGLPAKSLPELIALAKAQPGKLSYAVDISSGWAGIIGELLNRRAGIDMIQVPYKMTSQAISDTMAGTIQVMIGSAMSVTAVRGQRQTPADRHHGVPAVPGHGGVAADRREFPGLQLRGIFRGPGAGRNTGGHRGAPEPRDRHVSARGRDRQAPDRLRLHPDSRRHAADDERIPHRRARALEQDRQGAQHPAAVMFAD
jgi:hypothetical protein